MGGGKSASYRSANEMIMGGRYNEETGDSSTVGRADEPRSHLKGQPESGTWGHDAPTMSPAETNYGLGMAKTETTRRVMRRMRTRMSRYRDLCVCRVVFQRDNPCGIISHQSVTSPMPKQEEMGEIELETS